MDCRLTTDKKTGFLKILQEAFESGKPVNMMIDDGGLSRAHGAITSIKTNNTTTTIISLNNQQNISLDKLIAVNGVFSDDFSEC